MTETTPDAVKVAEDFCDAKGFEDYMLRAGAILGARAMQAAMPAPGGPVVAYRCTRPATPGEFELSDILVWGRETAESYQRDGWVVTALGAMPAPAGVRVKALMEFARGRIREAWEGCEDGDEIQDHARRLGLIVEVPGGYDPERHGTKGEAEPGEPWFVFADWLKTDAIEDAGAREGAEDPIAELVAAQEPLGEEFERIWDANAERLQEDTPTHAGAGDLVEQLRRGTDIRDSVLYTEADAHAADCTMKEAASHIEALEAEVARKDGVIRAQNYDYARACDERDEARTRATTAEADLAALRAEVGQVREEGFIDGVEAAAKFVLNSQGAMGSQSLAERILDLRPEAAALAPAKAGG